MSFSISRSSWHRILGCGRTRSGKNRAWDSTSSFVSNTGQLVAVCLNSLGPSFLICKKRKLDYISLQVSLGLNFYDSMQYLTLKKKSFLHVISQGWDVVDFTISILKMSPMSFRRQLSCLQLIHVGSRTENQILWLLVYHYGAHPTQQQSPEDCVESIISYSLNKAPVTNLHKFFAGL